MTITANVLVLNTIVSRSTVRTLRSTVLLLERCTAFRTHRLQHHLLPSWLSYWYVPSSSGLGMGLPCALLGMGRGDEGSYQVEGYGMGYGMGYGRCHAVSYPRGYY